MKRGAGQAKHVFRVPEEAVPTGAGLQLKSFAPDQDTLEHSGAQETQATGVA